MKKIPLIPAVFVIGFVFAFFAGIYIGLVSSSQVKPAEFVSEVIGSVGDWVSGLGALAAAVIAIYLADRQRKESLPELNINQHADHKGISIDVVSVGGRGVSILGIYLRSQKLDRRSSLADRDEFPKRLEFGEMHSLFIGTHMCDSIRYHFSGNSDRCETPDLEIVVETSTKTFTASANREVLGTIQGRN